MKKNVSKGPHCICLGNFLTLKFKTKKTNTIRTLRYTLVFTRALREVKKEKKKKQKKEIASEKKRF